MDIGAGNSYPSNALSNFAPHPFVIDGVECNSMEGFLQSLKFKEPSIQKEVCLLVGIRAKMRGKNKKWWKTQKLNWMGIEIDRHSKEYQDLLDRAFSELAKNEGFKRALLSTGDASLKHSIGKRDEHKTILTSREFCSRLKRIRSEIKNAYRNK